MLLIDTAGRLAIDETMMNEISALHKTCDPAETLFVVDAMTGQDAANTAKVFNETLPLTGGSFSPRPTAMLGAGRLCQ